MSPFLAAAEGHHARLAIIRCVTPDETTLRQRIEERGCPWDRWKPDHWAEFMEREPFHFPIAHDDVYEVISDSEIETTAQEVLTNYLDAIRLD